MATYKGIQGFTIQNLSADPSNPIEGQVWYNSTSNVWKVEEATAAGAWASGGNLPGNLAVMASAGTQTAGLASFGYTGTVNVNASAEYDGTSWTAGGTGSTARRNLGGCGIQTSALAFGGYTTNRVVATEEYDGSTWTGGGNLSAARSGLGGAGITNSRTCFWWNYTSRCCNKYNRRI
jgi:hypothetical protein